MDWSYYLRLLLIILSLSLCLLLPYLFSVGVTRLSIRLAYRWGALAIPDERSSHTQPTPRIGGLGLVSSVLIFTAVLLSARFWIGYFQWRPAGHQLLSATLAGGLI